MDINSYSYCNTSNITELIDCTDKKYPELGTMLTKETNWFNETYYLVTDILRDIWIECKTLAEAKEEFARCI